MKIAHCLPDQHWVEEMRCDNPRGAAYIQQKYIAEGLRGRGHFITWIAPQGLDHVFSGDMEEINLAPHTWTASGWFKLLSKVVWKIQQIFRIPYLNYFSNLRRYDACIQVLTGQDVAFERNSLYNSGVAMACKKLNLPYVMFFDADQIAELEYMDEPLTGLLRWRAKNILRYNLKAARQIISVSQTAKKHLTTNWNVPSDKVIVLSNAVDVERFKPDPELGSQTRALLRLTNNPLLVFVGSFYKWHDVVTLLKAFSVTLKKHANAHLILVGDGAKRDLMMKLSVDLNLEHAVHFTGFVGHIEVSRYVNAADIAIVPVPNMKQELWLSPMKLFEYMASGKAIVASSMGQIKEVIQEGQNGLLVSAGDEMALANAINKLIEDIQMRIELGKKAREDAVLNHSWEQYLSRLENVFIDVTGFPMLDSVK
jgi:glycosyltransferase involved in cell wall biosynthesis